MCVYGMGWRVRHGLGVQASSLPSIAPDAGRAAAAGAPTCTAGWFLMFLARAA